MIVFLILYAAVCLYGMKICTEKTVSAPLKAVTVSGQKWNDYMSREKTGAVKGIFVLMVFISHFNSCYRGTSFGDDFTYKLITTYIGQLMVTMFLFYSGYGIMESAKKKGSAYVKNLPVQRILKLLFDFDVTVLLFLLLNIVLGKTQKPTTIISAFFAWDSIGNSCWYIFAILCLYIFSFAAFAVFGKNKHFSAAAVTVLCGAYIVLMKRVKDDCWFNTVICYVFGMWFSLLREEFEKIVQRSNAVWAACLVASTVGFAVSYLLRRKFIMYEANCIFFVLCILLFTMKVSVDNKILRKLGELVFGVYILQKLPMMTFDKLGFIDKSPYLSFIACFVITILLAVGFNYFTKLTGKLFAKLRI